MKIKIMFILMALGVSGVSNSAEQSPPAGEAAAAVQSSETAVQTAQAKIEQTKAALSEIKEMLRQEEKALAAGPKPDKQSKESEKAAEKARNEIQKLRDQLKAVEKELAGQAKDNARIAAEAARVQKDRSAAESKTRQAEEKLAALQKDLADLKGRLAEATRQAEAAKKAARDLEIARTELEAEKNRRSEALARAEQMVARAEQAEKERLMLSSRIADIEQNLPAKAQESSDTAKIKSDIEAEKKAIAETGEQIKKEEKAREENEKAVGELKKQLSAKEKSVRAGGSKAGDPAELQKQLSRLRRQRAAAEERLKEAESDLQNGAKKVAALTIQAAAAQPEKDAAGSAGLSGAADLESALEVEKKALAEAERKIKDNAKANAESEKLIANLKNQLKAREKAARSSSQKEDQAARLQAQLSDLRKQRAAAEERLKKAEGKLHESATALAALSGTVFADNEKNAAAKESVSAGQAGISMEIEAEMKAGQEINDKTAQTEKDCAENTRKITELKEQLKASQETALAGEQKKKDLESLQKQLADLKKQRAEADERLQTAESKLHESAKTLAALSGTIITAGKTDDGKEAVTAEPAKIEKEIESAKAALQKTNEKAAQVKKDADETGRKIAELKEQLKTSQQAALAGEQKKKDLENLQKKLDDLKKQRAEADARLKETETKLQEGSQSVAALTGLVAEAGKSQGANTETEKNIARLEEEFKKETVLGFEAQARLDKLNGDLKAVDDQKVKLGESLRQAKERSEKDAQGTNRLSALNVWLAEKKKARLEAEGKVQQAVQKQQADEKELAGLKAALNAAGALVRQNENDLKAAAGVENELRKEKELSGKAAGLVQEKEKSLKQLAAEKKDFQGRMVEIEARLILQKEKLKNLQETQQALEKEKKSRAAAEKKYLELAKSEKGEKAQVKELEAKLGEGTQAVAATEKQAKKIKIVSPARKVPETPDSVQTGQAAGQSPLAAEEEILTKARSGGAPVAGQEIAEQKPEKSISRSKQKRLDEADARFIAGVQKWDENNLEGALADFQEVIKLNPDAAGAYYNISFVYVTKGKTDEACEYAYKAGECYLRINNPAQAARMAVLLMKINKDSPYILKLREKIAKATK